MQTARQFNAIRVKVEGKIASIKELRKIEIAEIKEQIAALEAKISRLQIVEGISKRLQEPHLNINANPATGIISNPKASDPRKGWHTGTETIPPIIRNRPRTNFAIFHFNAAVFIDTPSPIGVYVV
ncbi:MAG TPA: hypothetical protein VIH61_06510 [Waddliaceae bacterium]